LRLSEEPFQSSFSRFALIAGEGARAPSETELHAS
jgi:hypothetical protein